MTKGNHCNRLLFLTKQTNVTVNVVFPASQTTGCVYKTWLLLEAVIRNVEQHRIKLIF